MKVLGLEFKRKRGDCEVCSESLGDDYKELVFAHPDGDITKKLCVKCAAWVYKVAEGIKDEDG